MTVVFVVDTSASMNQRCANGLTLLDCAKSGVEHFLKMRARDFSWHRTDRYILVTLEDGKNAIKVVDRFPFTNFMRTLKSIEAHDLTQTGAALQQVFDYLHLQRLANDIDKYGQGRNPCSMEPTTILVLTDGTELTYQTGVLKTIVPPGPLPLGGELTSKPFRWDQRVSAIVLRIPSVSQQVLERSGPFPQNAPISGLQTAVAMDNDISAFCESTGGKCFVATSWKILMQHIDATSRLTTCVVVNFENVPLPGSVSPPQVHAACQRKLLFIKPNQPHQGHWPIPEAYWLDPSQFVLPSRDPHPTIAYKAVDSDPMIPTQFVYDKYEVESNPIVGFLLKAPAGACWQVFVRNSKGPQNGYGDPFGYLRLDRLGNTLNLYVLPYNYPVLFQLLDQASKFSKMSKDIWRQEMDRYFNSIPCYYGPPLRAALRQWGLNTHIVPESLEKLLFSGFLGNQLKRLKAQAKTEWENMTEKIMANTSSSLKSNQRTLPVVAAAAENPLPTHTFTTTSFSVRLSSSTSNEPALTQKTFEVSVLASPSGPSTPNAQNQSVKPINTTEATKVASEPNTGTWKDCAIFKNPFDVSREELLSQLKYLPVRVALSIDGRAAAKNEGNGSKLSTVGALAARFVAKAEEEARHSVPIEKMGDFSDALSKQQPPRNPFADEQERSKQQRFMFGNPYRQEKNEAADEAWLEGSGGAPFRGRKRRRRPESPSVSATSTSTSSSENTSTVSSPGNMEATSPARNESKTDGVDDMAQASSDSGTSISETEQDTPTPASELAPTVTEPAAPRRKKRPPRPEQDPASDFILAALRALRHATSSNDTELFELLVASEVPLDKSRLVEQLIHQAHCYKKPVIASRLVDFRSKLTTEGATPA